MANSLIKTISSALSNYTFNSEEESIAVACVTYKYISALTETTSTNSLREMVISYMGNIKSKVVSLKSKFVSYDEMINKIASKGKAFSNYTENDIEEIYKLYINRTLIKAFDTSYFDPSMYKISTSITYADKEQLSKCHKNIMIPIIKYYMSTYEIPASYMEISSAVTEDGSVGKEILFAIKGISSAKIVADIIRKSIYIDYYSVSTSGNYVKIILA